MMITICKLIIAIFIAAYFDFSCWYSAEIYNIWNETDKKKFRGVLWRLWDFIDDHI